jgi:hypothetical protein
MFTPDRQNLSNILQSNLSFGQIKKVGFVYDVILDETNERAKNSDIESALIGAITFRTIDGLTIDVDSPLPVAYPIDKHIKSLPVRNETVEIYEFSPGLFGYRRIGLEINPTFTAFSDAIESTFSPKTSKTATSGEYSKVQQTNIPRSSQNKSKTEGYGKYFEPQSGIHKLKLYEGDTLLESRFGQSIRFSAYNNDQKTFSPTTIIRNGESSQNRQVAENLPIEEDVNQDGSVIVLSSADYQLNFKEPTNTKPDSFSSLESKLVGNQLLLNSDRVIISSKNYETRFYSKKGFAFASDGEYSIDLKGGMEIYAEDNVTISARDRIIQLDSGAAGKLYLGSSDIDLEPVVKGNILVELLSELIEIVGQAQFATPAGPTAPGPTNVAKLQTLMGKLNSCLSSRTYTV